MSEAGQRALGRWRTALLSGLRRALPALILVTACTSSLLDENRDELNQALGRWQAAGPADYDFDLQHSCYCLDLMTRPVTISVRARAFVGIVYADSGTVADTTWFRDYLTVDRIFALLQRTIDAKPASYTASYHDQLGYPGLVHVDPISGAADDEFSIRILSLRSVAP